MKDRNHNVLRILKNIIKAILIICSAVAVIAGIFDQIGQARERREAKKTGKKIHKMNDSYEQFFKRPLDVFLSTGALIVLSPVMAVIGILVKFKLGSPVFFTQNRLGRRERTFKLIKFRSMTDATDKDGNPLPDAERLIPFGEKLRSTSLDELPELFNILKGDMSIVGPRPLPTTYKDYYTKEEHHRHDVRPGLSGLAQINGRSFLAWEQIFGFDLSYVKNVTLKKDVSIIIETIKKVLIKENIADPIHIEKEEDGKYHAKQDGKDYIVHGLLNEERSKQC